LPRIFKKICKNLTHAAPGIGWVEAFKTPIARYHRPRIFGRFVGYFRVRLRQIPRPAMQKIHRNSRASRKNRVYAVIISCLCSFYFAARSMGQYGFPGRTSNGGARPSRRIDAFSAGL
jgi:hypothetical protein